VGLPNTKISCHPEESQTLINYLSKVPNEPLSKKFEVVEQARPAILVVSVTLDDATETTQGCGRCQRPSPIRVRSPPSSSSQRASVSVVDQA